MKPPLKRNKKNKTTKVLKRRKRKSIEKIQYHFMIKILNQLELKGTFKGLIQLASHTSLGGERLDDSSSDHKISTLTTYI